MSGPIRVLLADDHAIVREGVRGMLDAEPDIAVVADASRPLCSKSQNWSAFAAPGSRAA